MLASTLMPAVEVYARGADNLRAVEEREHAEALRQAGDRAAQQAPVPSGKLTV
jgi:hypothetical protein